MGGWTTVEGGLLISFRTHEGSAVPRCSLRSYGEGCIGIGRKVEYHFQPLSDRAWVKKKHLLCNVCPSGEARSKFHLQGMRQRVLVYPVCGPEIARPMQQLRRAALSLVSDKRRGV